MHHRPRIRRPGSLAAALLPSALCLLAAAGLLVASSVLVPGTAVAQIDDATMEAFARAATPNGNHKRLAELAGSWRTRTTLWPHPGAEPVFSEGKAEMEMILDGRFLRQTFVGESMGQPFTGEGITGWDNVAGELVGTWVDNHGTGITIARGTISDDGKTFTQYGDFVDPASKESYKMRMVTRILAPDHHVFDIYAAGPDGQEHKSMSIDYRRK